MALEPPAASQAGGLRFDPQKASLQAVLRPWQGGISLFQNPLW
jgi:hypothetical protein